MSDRQGRAAHKESWHSFKMSFRNDLHFGTNRRLLIVRRVPLFSQNLLVFPSLANFSRFLASSSCCIPSLIRSRKSLVGMLVVIVLNSALRLRASATTFALPGLYSSSWSTFLLVSWAALRALCPCIHQGPSECCLVPGVPQILLPRFLRPSWLLHSIRSSRLLF